MKEATADEWAACTPSTGIKDTNYTVGGLKENSEYNFCIRATNSTGVGEPVELPGSVAPTEKVQAPEIELDNAFRKVVNVRACSTLRLFVTFSGRPEPEVRWSKEDGTLSECAQIEVTHSYTELMIENVNRNDSGKYVLTAKNCSGTKSAFINVRVLDSPSAPTNLEVKDVKRDSVVISWEPPLIDGGTKISHYIVEKREEARKAFTSVCSNCVRNSYKIDNLQEGSFYYFRVLAVNEFGAGQPAETADAVKVSEAPPPPGKITLREVTCNSARLSWEKPDHDGGSKITSGREYFFRVSAVNDKGMSEPKALLTPVIVKDTSAKPVINLLTNTFSVKVGNDLKIDVPFRGVPPPTVVWNKEGNVLKETSRVNVQTSESASQLCIKDAARFDAGAYEAVLTNAVGTTSHDVEPPIINLDDKFRQAVVVKAGDLLKIDAEIYGRPNPTVFWLKNGRNISTKGRVEISATKCHTSLLIRESVRKDSGQYTLTLQNTGGTTSRVVTCKVLDRPGPPAGPLEVSGLSAEKCTLSWGPPHEDGGAEVLHYIVEKCETSRVSWTLVCDDVMATTCKITKLLKGNEYLFRVRAVNKYGEGEILESEPIKAMDPFTIPSAPTDVEVTSATSESMTINWKRPASDGGSRISGYIIEKREKHGVRWVRVNKKPVYDLRVKASGLHQGCEYEFRVFAENAAGLSEPSSPSPLASAEDPTFLPSPPANTNAWHQPKHNFLAVLVLQGNLQPQKINVAF
uniref:Titin n=1 Tax=Fundulus heteroclitus TaxID=8078 RepID=A0A3Q2P7F9_FUNHE